MITNNLQITEKLQKLKDRLRSEVPPAYDLCGAELGRNRFSVLKNKAIGILNELLPGKVKNFEKEMIIGVWSSRWGDSEAEIFWKNEDASYEVYTDSLLIDIQNEEYSLLSGISESLDKGNSPLTNYKMFIIHRYDGEAGEKTACFIEKLELEVIILSEQANQGKTIIEKLEYYTDVGLVVVLCTGDDASNTEAEAEINNPNTRARQNVVFERGLPMRRLGRNKVIPLISGASELPSNTQGVVHTNSRG